jgi:hypothetical protein
MPSTVTTTSNVPYELLDRLKARLPSSVTVLRRLQFAKYNGATTPATRIISIINSSDTSKFTAAFVDFVRGPDTQMFIYSTLEDEPSTDSAVNDAYKEQFQALVGEVDRLVADHGELPWYPHGVLLGSLHTRVRRLLETMDRVEGRPTGYYDKWLFRAEDIPAIEEELPEGMSWDTATLDDCKVVVSRTDIPRTAYVKICHRVVQVLRRPRELLVTLPSQVIRIADGTPIAWAFICKTETRRPFLAMSISFN